MMSNSIESVTKKPYTIHKLAWLKIESNPLDNIIFAFNDMRCIKDKPRPEELRCSNLVGDRRPRGCPVEPGDRGLFFKCPEPPTPFTMRKGSPGTTWTGELMTRPK
jgi:hypothetical protein